MKRCQNAQPDTCGHEARTYSKWTPYKEPQQ